MWGIPEYGSLWGNEQIFAVESVILGFEIRNSAQGIQNPTIETGIQVSLTKNLEFSNWNPESTVLACLSPAPARFSHFFLLTDFSPLSRSLEQATTVWDPESRIQDSHGFPYMGRKGR